MMMKFRRYKYDSKCYKYYPKSCGVYGWKKIFWFY